MERERMSTGCPRRNPVDEFLASRAGAPGREASTSVKSEGAKGYGDSSDDEDYYSEPPESMDDGVYYFFKDDAQALKGDYKDVEKAETVKWCEVCGRTFQNALEFLSHHRRHQAPELFQCPEQECMKGYLSLKLCYQHEMKTHKKKDLSPGGTKKEVKVEGAEKAESSEKRDQVRDETVVQGLESLRVTPSSDLEPYQGPELAHYSDAIAVEVKHGMGKGRRANVEGFSDYLRILRAVRVMQDAAKNDETKN